MGVAFQIFATPNKCFSFYVSKQCKMHKFQHLPNVCKWCKHVIYFGAGWCIYSTTYLRLLFRSLLTSSFSVSFFLYIFSLGEGGGVPGNHESPLDMFLKRDTNMAWCIVMMCLSISIEKRYTSLTHFYMPLFIKVNSMPKALIMILYSTCKKSAMLDVRR